jgi:hypothetical protein
MTPADFRHLQQMRACIASLRSGATSLGAGADSLLFLRTSLETVEAGWDESFTAHVATLESAGLATSEQVAAMGQGYSAAISQALDDLETLVTSQLPSDGSIGEETQE